MNKFVKIKCPYQGVYPNWFLEFTGEHTNGLTKPMNEKLLRSIWSLHAEAEKNLYYALKKSACININYFDLHNEIKKPLYIRPNGVYMVLGSKNEIIDETWATHFPVTEVADIVICENDKKEEYSWKRYLEKRFPNKTIKTINFFDLRTNEDIKSNFLGAEFITFSTKFSSLNWFEKLVKNRNKSQKIIGFCHDESKWALIDEDVEIIKSI